MEQNKSKEIKKEEILSPMIDVVFQMLFGEVGSEKITQDFLSAILKEKIETISLDQNIVLRRELPKGKMGIVDVLAKINDNEFCNVEMQMADKKNMIKRMLYYWARQYAKEIGKKEEYKELKRTIVVLIANFEFDKLRELGVHSRWKIIEEERRKIVLTEDLEFNIIEVPKMYKEKQARDEKLIEWLKFLENPESKEVQGYMKKNENMKEAREKLDKMSKDEKVRRMAELRQKALMDEREAEYTGYSNGLEDGIKQGMKQGLEQGIGQGYREIAKKMKGKGKDINEIIELTGLSKEEIEKL